MRRRGVDAYAAGHRARAIPPPDRHARAQERDEIQRAVGCDRPLAGLHEGEKKLYQLTMSACQVVSGGNAQEGNAQVCSSLPNGGSQCTSNNGRSMVIQTYDSKGVVTNTTVCTENRQGSVSLSLAKQATGEVKGGGGTSCSSKTPASGSGSGGGSGATEGGQLLIYSPFFYGAP